MQFCLILSQYIKPIELFSSLARFLKKSWFPIFLYFFVLSFFSLCVCVNIALINIFVYLIYLLYRPVSMSFELSFYEHLFHLSICFTFRFILMLISDCNFFFFSSFRLTCCLFFFIQPSTFICQLALCLSHFPNDHGSMHGRRSFLTFQCINNQVWRI